MEQPPHLFDGIISSIKMNILPKLNYLFSITPQRERTETKN